MIIYKNLKDFSASKPIALSLGMFDGVHLGHQYIIKKLLEISKNSEFETGLLTFWPHPRLVFQPEENLKILNTLEEKTELLAKFGVQHLFLQEFDEKFRNLSGEEFIKDILVDTLHVKHLIVGHDHVFGKNKSGNFALLQEKALEFGYTVEQTEAVHLQNQTISSTKIRKALSEGKIMEANAMLGYPYRLSGTVMHGKKIGRTLGYPTANIAVNELKLLPKKGAYIVDVLMDNTYYKGMLSVGTNPTIGENNVSVEVFILNFSEDIYEKKITVFFREFLHDEIKFESLEQLIIQLKEDEKSTERFFQSV